MSLWSATAATYAGRTAAGELETDVAVVGGGIAGLSTALHLNELGIEAVVLEARYPGGAATGASGGILAPEFARDGIEKASRLYGSEAGERLVRLVGRSASYTFELIERHGIRCGAQQAGFVSPVQSARELDALHAESRSWKSLGCPVEFLDARATAAAIGTELYAGALYFESGGALNPLAYATGLAKTLADAGVPVFTNSPVETVERTNKTWQLKTPEACVRARRVVLAANGGNAALHAALSRTTLPLLVHEYATAPLSGTERAHYLGKGLPYTDRQAYVFTSRLADGGRIVSALPEVFPKWDEATFQREAARRLHEAYAMPLGTIDYIWTGTAYLNPSLLPVVYVPEQDLSIVAVQACNGRGLGVNTILGSQVAEMLAGKNPQAMAVPPQVPRAIPAHSLAALMPRLVLSMAQVKSRWRHRLS